MFILPPHSSSKERTFVMNGTTVALTIHPELSMFTSPNMNGSSS